MRKLIAETPQEYKPRKRKRIKDSSRAQTQRLVAREQSRLKQEKKVQEFQAGESYDKNATLEFSPVSHLQVLDDKTLEKKDQEPKSEEKKRSLFTSELPFGLRSKREVFKSAQQGAEALGKKDASKSFRAASASDNQGEVDKNNTHKEDVVDIAQQETNSFDAVVELSDTADFPRVNSCTAQASALSLETEEYANNQDLDSFFNELGDDFFQEEQSLTPWLDISDKIRVVKGSKPLFGSGTQEDEPKRAKGAISKQVVVRVLASCLATALVVGAGFFVWNRWLRYNDQLDFQGTWYLQDTEYSLVINGSTLELNKDTFLNYALNSFEKSISFSFGKDSAQALYEFSGDRNTLTLAEGKSPDIASILGIEPLRDQGVQSMVLVREGSAAAAQEPQESSKTQTQTTDDGAQGTGIAAGGKLGATAEGADQGDEDLPKPVFLEEFMKKAQE